MKRKFLVWMLCILALGNRLGASIQAKQPVDYLLERSKQEGMIPVFEDMYDDTGGTISYRCIKKGIVMYTSKAYEYRVKGLKIHQLGIQELTIQRIGKDIVLEDHITVDVKRKLLSIYAKQDVIHMTLGQKPDWTQYVSVNDPNAKIVCKGQPSQQPGIYTIVVQARSEDGQKAQTELTVYVEPDDFYNQIALAALEQLGIKQDCTMLVTNSLKAVGIDFHGAPQDYMQLGEKTDTPVPGDLIIYDGHVAVYIGDHMAVHGGWNHEDTQVHDVTCSQKLLCFIHICNNPSM